MRVRERVVSSNHKQKGDNKEERNLWEKKEFFNANKKDKKNSSHNNNNNNNTSYHRHARKNSHISSSQCVPFDDWPISRPPRRSLLLPVFIKVVLGTIRMPGGWLFCPRLGWWRRRLHLLLPREVFTNSVGIKSHRLNRRNTSNSAKSPANWGRNSRKTGFAVSTFPKSARS